MVRSATIAAMLIVAVLGVVMGMGGPAGAQQQPGEPPHTDVQARLDFAELRWDFSRIDSYEVSYVVTCFCPAPLPTVTVVVEDGVIVSATSSDGAQVFRPRTIPVMFAEIQAEIDRPAAFLEAAFDARDGHPVRYRADPVALIADEEFTVTVTSFTNNAFVELQEELDAARVRWADQAPATDNYDLGYRVICFCPQIGVQRVSVRNGDVIERTEDPFTGPARTVDELFDLIQAALDSATGSASVDFDSVTGVPKLISFDPVPGAVDDETTYQITDFEFVSGCCDPVPTLDVVVTCLNENGRIDVSFVSTTLADGPVEHAVIIGALAPRLHTVLSGETVTEVATGRPDGPLTVELRIGGELVTSETVDVQCDPERREVEVTVSCLAENGRFDIWLTGPNAVSIQPIPLPRFEYQMELTTPGRPPIVRTASVLPLETTRVTITGREDRTYRLSVERGGTPVFSEQFTVTCDVFDEPVALTMSCLAENGRFDIDLFNDGDAGATYVVGVAPLADRTRTIPAGASARITYTGRPDLPTDITVDRDGVRIFKETVTPDCDADCPDGYALGANGACVTPNANCEAPLLELETIGGVPFVDPITGEVTAIITYSCVATCDAPAFPGGPGRCVLALP